MREEEGVREMKNVYGGLRESGKKEREKEERVSGKSEREREG